ncbi:MAG: ribosome small subunit-dependent GTPase A [Chitinophagaceae bacterium]
MTGIVYKSTGSWYLVKDADGRNYQARIKGIFKIGDITSTNPLAVGDIVDFEEEKDQKGIVMIDFIHDRKNYINRQSPSHKMQHHIVASNLDQAIMFATLKDPKTSQGFIDRFLVACEAYHIPAVIIFNKSDLYGKKEHERFLEMESMYTQIGYQVLLMSVKEGSGVHMLISILKNKTSLISGHSGVGKSSFINLIFPDLDLRTKDVSGWSGKGLHTTTFAEMFDLPFGGKIIDTPGLREFGLVDISKQELSHYFPEMRNLIGNCQYNNCMHMNEPGCAIKEAASNGAIHIDRYISYCTILDSITEKNY